MVFQFWALFAILTACVVVCDRKFNMLRDLSKASPRPFSWSRVQLAWWSVIILTVFTSIIMQTGHAPNLHYSTLVLLGISAGTTAVARVIDLGDQQNALIFRHQDIKTSNFFLDILSDQNGVSIQRFQAVIFNMIFGIWFISSVLGNLGDPSFCMSDFAKGDPNLANCLLHSTDFIIPIISDNNLILLGLSSATYAALKITENKGTASEALNEKVVDEAMNTPAQG
ncbi:hypothetical protein A4H97_15205 [Niastella yeongjuensis]|uniref:Uncharacterized protein n=1 Tax=Niastella yeongjuensis TaxID=354355 RepID=A0A1V9E4A3_9BACT|nr:hypothetical protein [Niastella yeongjuensis]OQP40950.1 hypothetical protein A4H97_15205 [Niastella yeongjuensis]SEO96859.1 hypothetical protein SAMN05660816_04009 [Niastella yeongjuensis]